MDKPYIIAKLREQYFEDDGYAKASDGLALLGYYYSTLPDLLFLKCYITGTCDCDIPLSHAVNHARDIDRNINWDSLFNYIDDVTRSAYEQAELEEVFAPYRNLRYNLF